MWQYNQTNELYHYGVHGMKWGVRRYSHWADKAESKARVQRAKGHNQKARSLEKDAKLYRKFAADDMRNLKEAKGEASAKKFESGVKATSQQMRESSEFRAARIRARKDPAYKKSPEYRAAKAKVGKQFVNEMVYGSDHRVKTFQQRGFSEKRARGAVVTESILASVGAFAVGAAMGVVAKKVLNG